MGRKIMSPLVGKRVEFTALRITLGNPVTGVVVVHDSKDIEVELDHRIEGITTRWERGSVRSFRLDLIENLKEIK